MLLYKCSVCAVDNIIIYLIRIAVWSVETSFKWILNKYFSWFLQRTSTWWRRQDRGIYGRGRRSWGCSAPPVSAPLAGDQRSLKSPKSFFPTSETGKLFVCLCPNTFAVSGAVPCKIRRWRGYFWRGSHSVFLFVVLVCFLKKSHTLK